MFVGSIVLGTKGADKVAKAAKAARAARVTAEAAEAGARAGSALNAARGIGALDAPNDLAGSEPRPLEELLKDAERLVMVMVVEDPTEEGSVAYSLAWVETGEGLWLVAGAGDGEMPLALPVDAAGLLERISSVLGGRYSGL